MQQRDYGGISTTSPDSDSDGSGKTLLLIIIIIAVTLSITVYFVFIRKPTKVEDKNVVEGPRTIVENETWRHVTTFSGIGSEITDVFNIRGEKWRIRWDVEVEPQNSEEAVFNLIFYHNGEDVGSISHSGSSISCKGCGAKTHYINVGEGEYTIEVEADNLEGWTLEIEDLY
jgi:hypothetical protein